MKVTRLARVLLLCGLLCAVYFAAHSLHLDFEDALFLTKNSIKELKQHLIKPDVSTANFNPDPGPLNGVMNSVFPIDATIDFNSSHDEYHLIARYGSFSRLITKPVTDHYRLFPNSGCESFNASEYTEFNNTILVLLRGECTFVDKITTIVESGLVPKAIIIGNNEPYRGLVTMYSATFNDDGRLEFPMIFVTNEDFLVLQLFEHHDLLISLNTASLGNWANLLLSVTLLPPILILFFYGVVKFFQRFKRRRRNQMNQKIVKNLPVYVFNENHLIHTKHFYEYLTLTCQTDQLPSTPSSTNTLPNTSPTPTPRTSHSSMNTYVINGIDVKQYDYVLTAPQDFYPTYKCSICLDKFKSLSSRVLVLSCKHIYHEKCLANWLVNFRRSCPLCNKVMRSLSYLLAGENENYGGVDLEAQLENDENNESDEESPMSASVSAPVSELGPEAVSDPVSDLASLTSSALPSRPLSLVPVPFSVPETPSSSLNPSTSSFYTAHTSLYRQTSLSTISDPETSSVDTVTQVAP